MITYLKLSFMAIFWGGTFVAGRSLAQTVGPFSAAFFRFVIASAFLIILVRHHEGRFQLPKKHQILPVFFLGLTGVFMYNYLFLGEPITISLLISTVLVSSGVYLTNRPAS